MNLLSIWNSAPAWQTIVTLKKSPKLAYRLLKYQKKVAKELEICEEQRKAFVYTAADIPAGAGVGVELEPGTESHMKFVVIFNEFLLGESDLPWIGITMDELIDSLDAEKGNIISERDIELLEPFFYDRPKADLKVVESNP